PPSTDLYPLSLHDALPIYQVVAFLSIVLVKVTDFVKSKNVPNQSRQRLVVATAHVFPVLGLRLFRQQCNSLFGSWVHGQSNASRSEEHTSELQSRENLVCR